MLLLSNLSFRDYSKKILQIEKNPCFPQHFLSYYTWRSHFVLKNINFTNKELSLIHLNNLYAKKAAQE